MEQLYPQEEAKQEPRKSPIDKSKMKLRLAKGHPQFSIKGLAAQEGEAPFFKKLGSVVQSCKNDRKNIQFF